MKDYYKQQIEKVAMEKIAARAWKKVLPKLSDVNYKRLVDAGVYNKNKELQGLRRGTHNILQKYDAKMIRKPNKAGAATAEMVKEEYNLAKQHLPKNDVQFYKNMPGKEMSAYSGNSPIQHSKPYNSTGKKNGFIFTPKGEHNQKVKAEPTLQGRLGYKPIPRRDRDGRKWSQAITERHEADEIRYGTINRKKGIGEGASYESHISPKVLSQESANMAIVPREAKNIPIRDFRNNSGEAAVMEFSGGVPYGSSGVYNKKAAKKAEKYMIDYNNSK